ncbi:MAG: LapA family protein [Thermodesulfobacteriota bacterium]|nr:LapA family protein [Thermodesulfobacteriota bacterium]
MYLSLITTFLLLLIIIITGMQNSMLLELKFIIWELQMSLTALIFYSSLLGGAIVAVLALPKLVKNYLRVKSLNRKVRKIKKETVESGKSMSSF